MIELGQVVKDKVTGFKGTATARAKYLAGCDHIQITPGVNKDGSIAKSEWFDEPMVEIISKRKKVKPINDVAFSGGPIQERNLPKK